MRVLLLFRGAPGCGKSTFIEKNNLKPYTLSADDIRLLYSSPILFSDGKYGISQENDCKVWNTLFNILENRMQQGEFTVIDATNSKTIEMKRYKELANTYRYRIFCIDMTDVPIEIAKEQNKQRSVEKQVPEQVIDKMYARFKSQNIPSGIKIIKPNELDTIWYNKPIDFSLYNKIHIFGDIHGCNTVLQKYFKDNPYNENDFYLFLGDYVDRGIENAEVMKFLLELYKNKNTMFLEGNHEKHLRAYGKNRESLSKVFEFKTKVQLLKGNISEKEVNNFCNKLAQCCYFKYYDKEFLVSHGGISCFPENLTLISTEQFIKGAGKYNEMLNTDKSFTIYSPENVYQIHGHRNIDKVPIQVTEKTFNLEGDVEHGGELRVLQITKDDIIPITIKNDVYEEKEEITEKIQNNTSTIPEIIQVSNLINKLENNKYIKKKEFGNISSFNFTSKVFNKKIWNTMTIKARGLYIDTINNEIAARSYDKFFNIDEQPETELVNLQYKFKFPVTAYVKENGFLSIISWDKEKDDLLIATKSSIIGDYVDYVKNILYKIYSDDTINKLKEYLKNNNVSFVFECCDHINDAHIIDYEQDELILLDIIYNEVEYKKLSYEELIKVSEYIDLKHKEKACVLNNWEDFYSWYNQIIDENYKYKDKYIEGFVIEDICGFMVKVKLHYYKTWKKLRQVFDSVLKLGYYKNTGSLLSVLDNEFYQWSREFYNKMTPEERKDFRKKIGNNMCLVRKMFYEWKKNN